MPRREKLLILQDGHAKGGISGPTVYFPWIGALKESGADYGYRVCAVGELGKSKTPYTVSILYRSDPDLQNYFRSVLIRRLAVAIELHPYFT